ncbi:MAG: diaminopimelate epimerase [Thermodesulfobacteriota bacterium]
MRFPIPFAKMSGSGNDFILVDHREPCLQEAEMPAFAAAVCRRRFSVGADGLILLEPSPRAAFRWRFFNADGSPAAMCGNGARCAARFAVEKGIARPTHSFETGAGIITAEVLGREVRISLTAPSRFVAERPLLVSGQELRVASIDTGVPHAVHFVSPADLERVPVADWGRTLRLHPEFAPAGTNANFAAVVSRNDLRLRTYERGVEAETMACGTGAVAAVLCAALAGRVDSPVAVVTTGGERLTIHFQRQGDAIVSVQLQGGAALIYEGLLGPEAIG